VKKQWLRLPALVLALMIAFAGSASVLAQDDAELSGSLLLWHGWTGAEADALNNEVLPAWEAANPGVTIETLAVPFDQLRAKYETESATGGGPDLLIGPLDWVGGLATAELIQPLDGLVDQAVLNTYLPSTLEALTFNDQLYGLPESFETVALYYNKTLVPEPPATTADLATMSAAIADENPDNYGFALFSNFYHPAGYLFGFGAQLFDENNMSALNSPETVNFLTWLQEFTAQPGVFQQNDDAGISSLFKEGRAAMVINGPWALGDYTGTLGAENVGVAPLPAITENGDAPPAPFLGMKHIMINWNADEEQAALAAAFATWFTGPESAGILAASAGHLPANTGVDVSGDPIASAFIQQAENATPLPLIPEMGQVWEPAGNMITTVLSGDATPEEAAAAAAEAINAGIEQMQT
jgi:arabinogalactan oligomer/maltooligosaccharide transport system substrate-binding protein